MTGCVGEVNLATIAKSFVQTSYAMQARRHIKNWYARLPPDDKVTLMEHAFDSMVTLPRSIDHDDEFLRAVDQVKWLAHKISRGRHARAVLRSLRSKTYYMSFKACAQAISTLVPEIAFQCLLSGQIDSEPGIDFHSDMQQYVSWYNRSWTSAIDQGYQLYTAHVIPLLLDATPLAEVLVSLVSSYI
jgi:hypothetical protein